IRKGTGGGRGGMLGGAGVFKKKNAVSERADASWDGETKLFACWVRFEASVPPSKLSAAYGARRVGCRTRGSSAKAAECAATVCTCGMILRSGKGSVGQQGCVCYSYESGLASNGMLRWPCHSA